MVSRIFFRPQCTARRLQSFHMIVRSASGHVPAKKWSTHDLETLLAEPAWSIETLLPPKTPAPNTPGISSKQLHHLLRLCALPLPKNPTDEAAMLDTLSAQLHFVGEMQQAETTGVTPLRAIRDETKIAEQEHTITLDTLKEAFAKEKTIGKHYKRIQRDTTPAAAGPVEDWPVLASAERKVARYFVVESERPQE